MLSIFCVVGHSERRGGAAAASPTDVESNAIWKAEAWKSWYLSHVKGWSGGEQTEYWYE